VSYNWKFLELLAGHSLGFVQVVEGFDSLVFWHESCARWVFRHLLFVFQLDALVITLLSILVQVAWHLALVLMLVNRSVSGLLWLWLELKDCFVVVVTDVVLILSRIYG